MNKFKVILWGVMGSCAGASPAAGEAIGMNTPCVQIDTGHETVILDSGTGIVPLGRNLELQNKPLDIHLFITHQHGDHLQGFPFFGPAYDARNKITIYGQRREEYKIDSAIKGLMKPPYFPVPYSVLKADIQFVELSSSEEVTLPSGLKVSTIHSDHPGGNLIYRFEQYSKSICYVTDLTHGHGFNDHLSQFVKDTNLMIYDANFTNSEFVNPIYQGYGHSTWEKAVQLSVNTNIEKLVLFHHAIHRTKEELIQHLAEARKTFPNTWLAIEGQCFNL